MSLSEVRSDPPPSVETGGPLIRMETPAPWITRLVLNQPKRRNALSEAMMATLHQTLDDLAEGAGAIEGQRAVIIAAEGPAFCAGHDLKEMTAFRAAPDRGRADFERTMRACAGLMTRIVRHPLPIIAQVEGIATAAGCQLVASCDLAVAGRSARFATPGVHIGLFCSTPMVALSRDVPRKRALEMLLTGEMIDAETAAQWALVNQVVDDGAVADAALVFANRIATRSPLTVRIGKEAFARQIEVPLETAYADMARTMVDNMMARDAEEGIEAFLQKRTPEWTGQ